VWQVFFVMGEFALVIIAVALPSWRSQFAAGAVLCAASLLLWFLVPESGRWLQVQGRAEEAYQVGKASQCSIIKHGACGGACHAVPCRAMPCHACQVESALLLMCE
jgi:hypothetical protein